MKRYVKEFAADEIASLKAAYKDFGNPAALERIPKIERIISACKRGMITDREAVRLIANPAE